MRTIMIERPAVISYGAVSLSLFVVENIVCEFMCIDPRTRNIDSAM